MILPGSEQKAFAKTIHLIFCRIIIILNQDGIR